MILALLACTAPVDPVQQQRDALRAYERDEVEKELSQALTKREQSRAAELCVHARQVKVETAGALCAQLLNSVKLYGVPSEWMQVHATLYEAASTAEARRYHAQRTYESAVRHRYAEENLADSRAAQVGVTTEMGLAAAATIRQEYVVPLQEQRLLETAHQRLVLLATLRGVFGGEAGATVEPLAEGEFTEVLSGLYAEGLALGLPLETVVAELTEALFMAADPHSAPVWPAEVESWNAQHSGVHPGRVGLTVEHLGDRGLRVIGLHPDGSAWKAGVHLNDRIVALGEPVGSWTPSQVASALRGPDGSTVELTVERAGAERSFTLTRTPLRDRTVHGYGKPLPVEGGQFLRIGGFRPYTPDEFDSLLDPSTRRLILDLRGNSGGDLDAALTVIDRFQKTGPMVRIVGRAKPAFPEGWGLATPGGSLESLEKVVVLVDHQTGSSAEIVAGALQRNGAVVIGSRTVGKGSSQVLRLDEARGFGLQFTNLHWQLGDGTSIHRTADSTDWGVKPDVELSLSPTERYAVGVLQAQREAPKAHTDGSEAPYFGPTLGTDVPPYPLDPQIERALTALGDDGGG